MRRIDTVLTTRARVMRADMSLADVRLWTRLRHASLGVQIIRQYAVGPYILDFACRAAKLAIEIDGECHRDAADYDLQRTEWLEARGWRVLRFSAIETLQDSEAVARTIEGVVAERLPSRAGRGDRAQPDGGGSERPAGGSVRPSPGR